MHLLPLLAAAALAQGVPTDRPEVPSAGVATENGPGALWGRLGDGSAWMIEPRLLEVE